MYKEIYRNYLNERRGVHLISYLSEETLIRKKRWGALIKKIQNRY